jgi:hypothetical protein
MLRTIFILVLTGMLLPSPGFAAERGFNPLRIARDAADLGLDTAKRAVDLGLDTAEGAVDIAKDAVTDDPCPTGHRYKGRDGEWHTCR